MDNGINYNLMRTPISIGYKCDVVKESPSIVRFETYSYANYDLELPDIQPKLDLIHSRILDLEDEAVRKVLIELGWTPPEFKEE